MFIRYIGLLSLSLCACTNICVNAQAQTGAQTHIQCPDKIMPTGITLTPAIKTEGWDYLASDMPIWLTNLTIYDGPVIQNAALAPNVQKNNEEFWEFKSHPGVKFLSCEYANGAFKLFKPLPNGLTACRLSVKKSSPSGILQGGFICW
ncbi:MAG: hypothetical protein RL497_2554 [Pseudomonadota bacterium]|jgi:hypothetical protein